MNRVILLSLGLGARALSLISGLVGDWLLDRLASGATVGIQVARDLCDIGEWLISALAQYFVGAPAQPYWN